MELCWLSPKIAANSTYLFLCSCLLLLKALQLQRSFGLLNVVNIYVLGMFKDAFFSVKVV